MKDRELLELAAKAAGISIHTWSNAQAGGFLDSGDMRGSRNRFWNPLDDDGDALRLAVKLHFTVLVDGHEIEVFDNNEGGCLASIALSPDGNDCPYAETRRAIVCAAAEIDKVTA